MYVYVSDRFRIKQILYATDFVNTHTHTHTHTHTLQTLHTHEHTRTHTVQGRCYVFNTKVVRDPSHSQIRELCLSYLRLWQKADKSGRWLHAD
jgi:hypothetical protein